jgi:hypothetical protein
MSSDGLSWVPIGGIITGAGFGVAWNGSRFVATGYGTSTLAWSTDGFSWAGLGTSIFDNTGLSVAWNGKRFVAGGNGTVNALAVSSDGIEWTGLGRSVLQWGRGVASNPRVGAVLVDSAITLTANNYKLDFVTDTYYNSGYNNFSCNVKTSFTK